MSSVNKGLSLGKLAVLSRPSSCFRVELFSASTIYTLVVCTSGPLEEFMLIGRHQVYEGATILRSRSGWCSLPPFRDRVSILSIG